MKTLSHQDYEKLIAEVEQEFSSLLAKAETSSEQPLVKSEDEKKEDKKDEDKKEAAPADEAKKDDDKKEDGEKKEESSEDDKCDYDDQDLEELHKMYGSMNKSELGVHKGSLEKAWMSKCGDMSKSEQPIEVKEEIVNKQVEGEAALLKAELTDTKAKLEAAQNDLKKTTEELATALNNFLAKKGPVRKAITSIETIKKNEIESAKPTETKELSKSEIMSKLNKAAKNPSLSKSDREAINQYCLGGNNPNAVKHLLS